MAVAVGTEMKNKKKKRRRRKRRARRKGKLYKSVLTLQSLDEIASDLNMSIISKDWAFQRTPPNRVESIYLLMKGPVGYLLSALLNISVFISAQFVCLKNAHALHTSWRTATPCFPLEKYKAINLKNICT